MFNSTHTLVGLALARSGLDRWAPYAGWTAVIASNLPDIDIVTEFAGTASYIDHHRGITHAIAGIPFLALLLAFAMSRISQIRKKPCVPLRRHFAIALLAMATHPLLDWTNTYGVRPLLPAAGTWYYGDLLFVIDPYLDLILLTGVILSGRGRAAAPIALLAALAYLGVRVESRALARRYVAEYSQSVAGLMAAAVQPDMFNPFIWYGFIEARTEVCKISIDLRTHETQRIAALPQPPRSAAVAAAEATSTGTVFRNFARFPVTRVVETAGGYRVLLIDFRFYREGAAGATALAADIFLDRALKPQSESMSFNAALP